MSAISYTKSINATTNNLNTNIHSMVMIFVEVISSQTRRNTVLTDFDK